MKRLLNTLYVTTQQAYLARDGETVGLDPAVGSGRSGLPEASGGRRRASVDLTVGLRRRGPPNLGSVRAEPYTGGVDLHERRSTDRLNI